jgi:hypothetical protein
MATWRGVGQVTWLLGLTCLVSCVSVGGSQRSGTPTVLREDHPRGPGSFCALNPEGCPPPPPKPAAPKSGTFSVESCLQACEAGGAVLESYCRGLAKAWQQRICWSVVLGTKVACQGMCYRVNACNESADCPERDD